MRFVALEAVGDAVGWGRVVVRDDRLPSGMEHSVHAWLFGLEPFADYSLEIGGIGVATVTTNGDGDAVFALHSRGKGGDGVPPDLPPAAELGEAVVLDASLAPVLEGSFTVIRQNVADVVYHERIELEDSSGGQATGTAAVVETDSREHRFMTHASGLQPGLPYDVVVDDVTLAVVTADLEGQASLEMSAPAENNPLPEEVLPVSQLGTVGWYLDELLVLWGAFSGESECNRIRGEVGEVLGDGFTLEVGERTIRVVVGEATRFRGLDSLGDLESGDVVVVEGCWRDELLVAAWVLLAEDDDV